MKTKTIFTGLILLFLIAFVSYRASYALFSSTAQNKNNHITASSAFPTPTPTNTPTPTPTPTAKPDLTAAKSHTPSGSVPVSQAFTWKIHIPNGGTAASTFNSTDKILVDNLPSSGASYGSTSVSGQTGITGTGTISCSITSNDLTCTASGGTVIIAASTGAFDVTWSTTPSSTGSLVNPRTGTGTKCAIDPDNHINESNEGNNTCSETVTVVAAPTSTPTPTPTPANCNQYCQQKYSTSGSCTKTYNCTGHHEGYIYDCNNESNQKECCCN